MFPEVGMGGCENKHLRNSLVSKVETHKFFLLSCGHENNFLDIAAPAIALSFVIVEGNVSFLKSLPFP